MTFIRRALALAGLVIASCALPKAWPPSEEIRAIWVTRYDYKTEDDVRTIIRNCADLGLNQVIFQVRGNGDAFYRSDLEVWGQELGGDPGFDPLNVAVEEAHRHGLRLHAWINVMPAWKGEKPPQNSEHLFHRRPEWLVVDKNGRTPALKEEQYVPVNPARDDVQEHLAAVAADIVSRYAVDGLHLDYIRCYVEAGDFSHDPVSLQKFAQETSVAPDQAPQKWTRFRMRQVTACVRKIAQAVRRARPSCVLSAAVFRTMEARRRVMQDAEEWLRERLVDRIFVMNYDEDDERWSRNAEADYAVLGSSAPPDLFLPVVMGIGVYKHAGGELTQRQIQFARTRGGFCLFSYMCFYPTPDKESPKVAEELRRSRRDRIRDLLCR